MTEKYKKLDINTNDPYNSAISVKDACDMLRMRIPPNERPYTVMTMKKNDSLIDEWRDGLLSKFMNDSGQVSAGLLSRSWLIFLEGKEVRSVVSQIPHMTRPSNEQKEYWMELLSLPMTELYDIGKTMVSYAWNTLLNEFKIEAALKKYELVFHDENYEEWMYRANHHKLLFEKGNFPFWNQEMMDDVSKKVNTILQNQMKFQDTR